MKQKFSEIDALNKLRHYLPAQAPLKDFVHHNTLHAFQHLEFFTALRTSATLLGNKTTLSLTEFRQLYSDKKITDTAIDYVVEKHKSFPTDRWRKMMFEFEEIETLETKVGQIRTLWKTEYKVDMDVLVHPNLFKLTSSYLDQGISTHTFPENEQGLLSAVLNLQKTSYCKIFRSKRVIELLDKQDKTIVELLNIIVGDEEYFMQYLFDQQFSHPGWSGMVATIEKNETTLWDKREITLFDFIYLELLFEIEAIESFIEKGFSSLATKVSKGQKQDLFGNAAPNNYWEIIELWQKAYEHMYFDQVLKALKQVDHKAELKTVSFQAFFCIDDREESIRRHIEFLDDDCQTFGAPAHFGIEAMYQPENGKFHTQICPGNALPKHLIKEKGRITKNEKDVHFQRRSHDLIGGWIISQTVGFWSALKLFLDVFKPSRTVAHSSSFEHIDTNARLALLRKGNEQENGLLHGFSLEEMADIVFKQLSSTGLISGFSPLVYFFGHGGSSTNNPYYAGYNCGACSGKPSSVNAKAFCRMANNSEVRQMLKLKGISIPFKTQFLGGLHDTTKDEFAFYAESELNNANILAHQSNKLLFEKALGNNAKERARQFKLIDIKAPIKTIHKKVKERSYALFEPRPELNHSNNALCIVGRRDLTKSIFLDQRAFLNSYNYSIDPDGKLLAGILNAATPVCGGINLEYFFSRVDNEKLGAGSKLPQNVVGLIGVANGIKGDLRPGLPFQMIDVHDPLRLMMIVEHKPSVVLNVIEQNNSTLEWYKNGWVKLAVIDPVSKQISIYENGGFEKYEPLLSEIRKVSGIEPLIESTSENLPVYELDY